MEIRAAESVCALRFCGYEYEQKTGLSEHGGLPSVAQPIIDSLVLHKDENDNFAAFFALQRGLHKWGGEYLTKYSTEHIAYDFLFLHLYRMTPPEKFTDSKYFVQWEENFSDQAETIAAFVRKSFRRVGRGKKLNL